MCCFCCCHDDALDIGKMGRSRNQSIMISLAATSVPSPNQGPRRVHENRSAKNEGEKMKRRPSAFCFAVSCVLDLHQREPQRDVEAPLAQRAPWLQEATQCPLDGLVVSPLLALTCRPHRKKHAATSHEQTERSVRLPVCARTPMAGECDRICNGCLPPHAASPLVLHGLCSCNMYMCMR